MFWWVWSYGWLFIGVFLLECCVLDKYIFYGCRLVGFIEWLFVCKYVGEGRWGFWYKVFVGCGKWVVIYGSLLLRIRNVFIVGWCILWYS